MPIQPSDPLYSHTSDNPDMQLVSKPFDGSGFGAWRKYRAIALSSKNNLGFVAGKNPKRQPDSPTIDDWQRCNDIVTFWILNGVDQSIAESLLYANPASQVWTELEDRYGQTNRAKLYSLQKEICSIDQGPEDIAGYFNKINKIWDEWNTLSIGPNCNCGATENTAKQEQDQCLIQFLIGLNTDYNIVR